MTLLELLLPAGRARGALVLGAGCPQRLRPRECAGGAVDLAVLAPAAGELAAPGWLDGAVAESATRLAPDGLLYALLPPGARRRAARALRARGLVVDHATLHLPDVATTSQIVPLRSAPARHALTRVVPLVPWKQTAAGLLLRVGGAGALAATAGPVALLARRPGARPLLEWLFALTGTAPAPADASAVISASWRAGGPRVVLQPFPHGARPVVAKVALDGGGGGDTEATRLERLGAAARSAGADVPRMLVGTRLHDRDVLVETRVEGDVLAPLLIRGRRPLGQALAPVCAWLQAWGVETAAEAVLDGARLEREILAPAAALAPDLPRGGEYLSYLRARCAAVEGTRVVLTAAHNDLTMWNVLVDADAAVGIVDWEAAEPTTLPLKDFFYATVDAVAATSRYADRPAAYDSCFVSGGGTRDAVTRAGDAMIVALRIVPEVVELSRHACWLGHASDESRSVAPCEPRPFLQIVRKLARAAR
ncbi:MAG: hypothetical protein ACLGI5_07400 [Thermoleophilia bacterium]